MRNCFTVKVLDVPDDDFDWVLKPGYTKAEREKAIELCWEYMNDEGLMLEPGDGLYAIEEEAEYWTAINEYGVPQVMETWEETLDWVSYLMHEEDEEEAIA